MDWEHITVFIRLGERDLTKGMRKSTPIACAFSAHNGGYVVLWLPGQLHHAGDHPISYVGWGSHANYPLPGRHRVSSLFAGLQFGRREASIFHRPKYDYIDKTVDKIPAGAKPIDVIVIPPAKFSSHGAMYWGDCAEYSGFPRHPHVPDQPCEFDFRWLNLSGHWGDPGSPFSGGAAPKGPPYQSSWNPFSWLSECEIFSRHGGEGYQLLRSAYAYPFENVEPVELVNELDLERLLNLEVAKIPIHRRLLSHPHHASLDDQSNS
jgi:hypothetical protein